MRDLGVLLCQNEMELSGYRLSAHLVTEPPSRLDRATVFGTAGALESSPPSSEIPQTAASTSPVKRVAIVFELSEV